MNIDEKDLEILRELEKNCKITLKSLSKKINISITQAYERTKRMERNGVIKGYNAWIDHEKLGFTLPAIIEANVEREKQFEVAKKLLKFRDISAVYGVTGDTDLLIIGRFKDRNGLTDFINTLFGVEGIIKTNTRVILNAFEKEKTI